MKKLLKNWGYFLITFLLITIAYPEKLKAQVGVNISIQSFYDELSPYGQWIDDPEYGYVWVPDAGSDFQPYASQGHWVVTQYGNTWVSDYPWGWAPFHYGRWRYNNYYGWQWIPGTEWGPAWVSWRNGGGYYGWAPMGPGVSVDVSFGPGYMVPHNFWVFVPQRYICDPYMSSYYVPRRNNVTIINRTTIINNTYIRDNRTYIAGPRAREIERVTRSRVNVYNINNESRPGRTVVNNRAVNIYRPEVSKTETARPTRVVNANERPGRENNAGRRGNVNNNRATENAVPNAGNRNVSRPSRDDARPATDGNAVQNRPANNERAEQPQRQPNVERPNVERPSRPNVNSRPAQTEVQPNVDRAAAQQAAQERASQQQQVRERAQSTERAERPQAPARQAQPEQRTAPAQPRVERAERPARSSSSERPASSERNSNARPSRER